jgi:Lipocalin-like domain
MNDRPQRPHAASARGGRKYMVRAFITAVALTAVLVVSPSPATTASDGNQSTLVGTWKLASVDTLPPDGRILNIWMGPHPVGLIVYQPNGYMAIQMMHDPRPMFSKSAITATSDELKNAYFGYYAYWGTYNIDGTEGTVEHNVQSSLFPAEVGRKYKRSFSINGTKLVLTTSPYKAGLVFPDDILETAQVRGDEQLVNRLTWERIE